MNDSFHVDVGMMELPKGGTKLPITSLVGDDNSLARKRSIIQINNSDNSCLAAAVGVAYASANTISTQEWKDLTKRDQSLSMPKLLLKYGKCPVWYKKHLSQRQKKQDDLARFLCREANADHWRPLTICDISKLEELLTVDILVVSARLGNKFIRVPSDENSYRQRLYLYLVEHDKTYHFHVISNISAFTSGSHFCKRCLKPYNKKHQCAISCFVCKRKENCFASDDEIIKLPLAKNSHRAIAGGNAPLVKKLSTKSNKTLRSTPVIRTFVNRVRKQSMFILITAISAAVCQKKIYLGLYFSISNASKNVMRLSVKRVFFPPKREIAPCAKNLKPCVLIVRFVETVKEPTVERKLMLPT